MTTTKALVIILCLMYAMITIISLSENYRDAHLGAACMNSGGNWLATTPAANHYECVRKEK